MKVNLLILWALVCFISCSNEPKLLKYEGKTMGTTYHIKYSFSGKDHSAELKLATDRTLISLNKIMSTYIADSEISLFNSSASTEWVGASKELLLVVDHALKVGRETDGVYDPTIGPLVNLWGFGPSGQRQVPSDIEIEKKLRSVGLDKLEVDLKKQAWKKSIGSVYVDLSSLAKGYGVDKIATLLESKGINNYMVEIGGEVRTRGSKAGKPWVIAIESPSQKEGKNSYQRLVNLNSHAMATSGNYRNFFKQKNKTYSHTIDYRTGRPVSHTLASVSVVDSKSCMNADAWATALMAMGYEKGFEIAEKLNIAAYFIYKLDSMSTFAVAQTTEFRKLNL
ncbi:FAD:protein FMN transferase [Halobacteriovorax sp. HLS]|uniref:FAD:protein FMN transferase n=1 Tax=Halobacteriovorax sp. HLS TaxID=2234000 RepID=UPI000FDA95FF|nr:FAD:protein FMN transferase [Halobacteriovorax sp. HLS]